MKTKWWKKALPWACSLLLLAGCSGGINEKDGESSLGKEDSGPTVKMDVRAVARSYDSILVSWIDPSLVETGYVVQRSSSPEGPFDEAGRVGPNTTCFMDTGLQPGMSYYYRVGLTTVSKTEFSFEQATVATLVGPFPPVVPDIVRVKALSANSVKVDWVDNSPDETGFKVVVSDSSGAMSEFSVPANTQTFAVIGLAPLSTYGLTVKALKNGLESNASATSCAEVTTLALPGSVFEKDILGPSNGPRPRAVIGKEATKYDELGRISSVSKDLFSTPAPVDSLVSYVYENNNVRVNWDGNADGTVEAYSVTTYDEQGNETSVDTELVYERKLITREFDGLGRLLLETIDVDKDGVLDSVNKITYDAQERSKKVEWQQKTETGISQGSNKTIYDSDGLVLRQEEPGGWVRIYDSNGYNIWYTYDLHYDVIYNETGICIPAVNGISINRYVLDNDNDGKTDSVYITKWKGDKYIYDYTDEVGLDFIPEYLAIRTYTPIPNNSPIETVIIYYDYNSDGVWDFAEQGW